LSKILFVWVFFRPKKLLAYEGFAPRPVMLVR
jgi:hypothetical protein